MFQVSTQDSHLVQSQVEEDGGSGDHDEELHHVDVDDGSQAAAQRAQHGQAEHGEDAEVEVPPERLLDEDSARVEVHGDLGEDVEDHGEDGEVHGDPPPPEPLHHVLGQGPHLAGDEHRQEDEAEQLQQDQRLGNI